MLVGPVERTHFFSHDGKVNLRGRWSNWKEQLEKRCRFHGSNKLLGAEMLGYTAEHHFSTARAVYPLLRPAMEELFEEFKPAFLANAAYRFPRSQAVLADLGPESPVAPVGRGTGDKVPRLCAFLGGYCLTASPRDLEARLQQLADGTMRMTCINYLPPPTTSTGSAGSAAGLR
jgi:hypothetical protein